jgi:hypothetical protein
MALASPLPGERGWARGITVNNVQPGSTDTDLNPAAGESAALVAFVASPEASYITGANLTGDGGAGSNRWAAAHVSETQLESGRSEADRRSARPGLLQTYGLRLIRK